MTPNSTRDVRMRGFAERATVQEALQWVDAQADVLEGETIDLEAAAGRVLAADVVSPIDVPSFDRAAMDGYALKGTETEGAGDYNPLSFRVIGESLPGSPFDGELQPGTAVRIMTGAPVPAGADAVLPAEYATASDGRVEVTSSVSPGRHVGRRGEDVAEGSCLLQAGRRLRPQDVALIASLGLSQVTVVRRPRVRLVITGEELVPPGQPRGEHQIYESNSSMLQALLARDGGELESKRHVTDDRDAIREALTLHPVKPRPVVAPGAANGGGFPGSGGQGADVILVSGGSSVGAEDHAPSLLAQEGELAIHGVAMRPSSPAGMGTLGTTLVFLLPGNPVSCLCAYDFFAGRAIRLLGVRGRDWPYVKQEATVGKKIVSAVGRVDYCRVELQGGQVHPLALSGASILSSTVRADGFVIVPAESEGHAPGSTVDVYLYDPPIC